MIPPVYIFTVFKTLRKLPFRLVLLLPPAHIYCILNSEETPFQTDTVVTICLYLLYFKLWLNFHSDWNCCYHQLMLTVFYTLRKLTFRLVLLLPPAYIYCILNSEETHFQTGTVVTTSLYFLYFKLWWNFRSDWYCCYHQLILTAFYTVMKLTFRLVLLLPPAYISCILNSEETPFQTGTVATTSSKLLYFKLWGNSISDWHCCYHHFIFTIF